MQDVLSFVKRKFKGLWFPYVLWTAVFSLLHNVFIKAGIYSPAPWSISEIGKNIIKSFFLHALCSGFFSFEKEVSAYAETLI